MSSHKFIISGVSGKIGSVFAETLQKQDSAFIGIYNKNLPSESSPKSQFLQIDLARRLAPFKKISHQDYRLFLHLAAQAHIDDCENDKVLNKRSKAWINNVTVTEKIIRFCQKHHKKLVFLSTDCVFDGTQDMYAESAIPTPINWYGFTKTEAEKRIQDSGLDYLIVRSVIVYGWDSRYQDIIRTIFTALRNQEQVTAVDNQRMTPTYIQDLITGVLALVEKGATGIYHLAGSSVVTPYQIAQKIQSNFGFDSPNVQPVTLEKFFGKEKSQLRPQNACLDSSKFINETGIIPLTIEEGLARCLQRNGVELK